MGDKRLAIIFMVLILCSELVGLRLSGAEAAARRAILNIRNIHQWLDLSYLFEHQKDEYSQGDSSKYTDHLFEEMYHMDCRYAIYDYRILNGRFAFDTGLVQEDYTSTYNGSDRYMGYNLEYDLDGTIFTEKTVPFSFFSSVGQSRVSRRFSQSYDLTRMAHGISAYYKSRILPTSVSYSHTTSSTDGLVSDSDQTVDAFNFVTTHLYKRFSQTTFTYYNGQYETEYDSDYETQEADNTRYSVRNRLDFGVDTDLIRVLESEYINTDDTGYYERKSEEWRERLIWDFGRALNLTMEYDDSSWETDTQNWDGWSYTSALRHRLYESLDTNLRYYHRKSNYDQGDDTNWYWSLGFDYRKQLPAASYLSLGIVHQYGETDRNVDTDRISVLDEPLRVTLAGPNYLNYPDVVESSIVVRRSDGGYTYDLGTDYVIAVTGRRTEIVILPGGLINDGDTVLVSYDYLVNPSIKYSTTMDTVSGSLSLFGGEYRIYGQYTTSTEDLLSGEADTVYLNDYTMYLVGGELRRSFYTFGAEYGDVDSTIEKYRYVELWASYNRFIGINNVWINIRNRNTEFYETDTTGPDVAGNENQFTASAVVSRMFLFRGSILKFGTYLLDNRGRDNTRTELSFDLSIEGQIGNTHLILEAEHSWLWTEWDRAGYDSNNTTTTDYVSFKLRRFF